MTFNLIPNIGDYKINVSSCLHKFVILPSLAKLMSCHNEIFWRRTTV